MALWKPFRGSRTTLDSQPLHDGYVYFCIDDGTLFFDFTDADGNLQRKQINAKDCESVLGLTLEEIQKSISWNDLLDKPEQIQSDWFEGDNTSPAYIKNRTHWIEENIVEAVPETTLESNGYIYGSILSISSGTRCIVTWEGTEYICTARRDPNGMYKALVGDMTGNEPFELSIYMSGYVGPPGLCAKAKSSDGVVEGKIISIKIDKSVVHKLDTKYLPDNLAYMPKKSSVFLSSADWTGEGNLWSQPVIITAATATSKIDLLPTASQIVSLQSEEISLMIENDNGELTAYAIGGRPSTFYTMDVLLTEVVLV